MAYINNGGGYWVANAIEKVRELLVRSKKSSLISSYSLLDTDAKIVVKKPKKAWVLKLMADYYQGHKDRLSPGVKKHRDFIIELLMEGMPDEDAI